MDKEEILEDIDTLKLTGMLWKLAGEFMKHPLSTTKVEIFDIEEEDEKGKLHKKRRFTVKTFCEAKHNDNNDFLEDSMIDKKDLVTEIKRLEIENKKLYKILGFSITEYGKMLQVIGEDSDKMLKKMKESIEKL